jgi:hypothetical protein
MRCCKASIIVSRITPYPNYMPFVFLKNHTCKKSCYVVLVLTSRKVYSNIFMIFMSFHMHFRRHVHVITWFSETLKWSINALCIKKHFKYQKVWYKYQNISFTCAQKCLFSWQKLLLLTRLNFVNRNYYNLCKTLVLCTKVNFVDRNDFCHDKRNFCVQKWILSSELAFVMTKVTFVSWW